MLGGQIWDVFISHASEDKAAIARPLRDALTKLGVAVWLDEAQMRIGHSLRRKIDEGIKASRYGVVVLSDSFFAKGWTNHELDGLVTRNVAGEQSLLPIWHNLSAEDVRRYSPSLADKVAMSTSDYSIEEIARQIADVVQEENVAQPQPVVIPPRCVSALCEWWKTSVHERAGETTPQGLCRGAHRRYDQSLERHNRTHA
ncbi:hypothetical protein GCM10010340_60710 [Streptomyces griseoloalbus]|nr:hypothetical protein GCM10010340_60710 [Streptomyces albaduncus]